jgi:hypothetical protein
MILFPLLNLDPENTLYDALYLNRGVKETFLSVSTPFAFLDRMTKKGGMKDLAEVLSKWNKGRHELRMKKGIRRQGYLTLHGYKPIPKSLK